MPDAGTAVGSPDTLDVGALLQPIPGDSPAGKDIRLDVSPASVYYKIKDARSAARAAERAAAADGAAGAAPPEEWSVVLDVGPRILGETSKDLEVTAWLVEALVRRHGFAGLRDGFRLARGLVEGFWDGLYPMPDEEGVRTRLAPIAGLNGEEAEGTLIAPILRVPVTQGDPPGPFALWQYQQALEIQRMGDAEAAARRVEAGAVTMEAFEKAVRETPHAYFRAAKADLDAALQEFGSLASILDSKCGDDAPPVASIRTTLQGCLEGLTFFAREALASAAEEGAGTGTGGAAAAGPSGGGGGAGGPIASRDQAFRALEEVAAFFRRTEPHSPLSFSLDQTVRWGRMPLPELLKELIPDASAREMYCRLSGIRDGETPSA